MDALSHLERDWALYQHHPVMPPGGMNLCHVSIQGGSYRAEMPPSCEVVYAVVYNPALKGDQVLAQIRAVIEGVRRPIPGCASIRRSSTIRSSTASLIRSTCRSITRR